MSLVTWEDVDHDSNERQIAVQSPLGFIRFMSIAVGLNYGIVDIGRSYLI
jgi:hypothetical protein